MQGTGHSILADIHAAEARLDGQRDEPAGTLSITAPVMFGHLHLTPLLNQWLKQHPQMRADLTLLDRVTDLLEEGFDLALRIGHLADSTLIARPLGHTGYVLCASPELLEQRGHPSHPQDLDDWPTVCFAPAGSTWHFLVDGKPWSQRIDPLIRANQIDTQLAAARDGLGLCRVLSYQAQQDFERGTLVPVLTDYDPPPMPVQFVFPHSRLLSPRVRHFMEAVEGALKARLAGETGKSLAT
ncbi:LysR substrate-binding domain-containing protein [Alloalcanivorax mobilis]|uniref:LysR substrate-binding domain-containing protein n=1 Tax=Alloalcanivorax mobilis TaxID=2019569 RepID=UPI002FCD7EE1